jgi:hypothetical protein
VSVNDRLNEGRPCLLVFRSKLLLPRRVPDFVDHPARRIELGTETANALEQVAHLTGSLGARRSLSRAMTLVALAFDGTR